MFINPKIAIENGWITGIVNPEKQIQPNAIDFTLDKLFTINDFNTFIIDEDSKKMRGGVEVNSWQGRTTEREYWTIEKGVYDGMSDIYVDVPDGVACMLIIRSTFNRNGIFLTSGLYDSGFKGHIGFAIHNRGGRAQIGVGTRFGQIIFVESENALQYAGGYNHEAGEYVDQAKPQDLDCDGAESRDKNNK